MRPVEEGPGGLRRGRERVCPAKLIYLSYAKAPPLRIVPTYYL